MRRRTDNDRGAVLVETVLVVPLLITLLMAMAEFGLAWRGRTTVQTAMRSGVRAGAALGNTATADYDILQSIAATLGSRTNEVAKVVVYRATAADGAVPPACMTASVAGSCNVYTSAAFSYPSSSFGCVGTIDSSWCPTTRITDVTNVSGLDYLGVYIEVRQNYVTGLFGNSITIKDRTVLRMEPQ